MSNFPGSQKLLRALTHIPLPATKKYRKRLLSEQNEYDMIVTQSNDECISANKRLRTESLGNESDIHNQYDVLSIVSRNDTKYSSLFAFNLKRRKSFTHISNLTFPYTSTLTCVNRKHQEMLACQQSPSFDPIRNENEQRNQANSSIFLSPGELIVYINSLATKLVIIDCGSPLRYNERRIKDSFSLNINDKLSRKRFLNRGLINFLDETHLNRLNQSEIIVLYDDSIQRSKLCSMETNPHELSATIKCVIEQIKKYNQTKTIYVLQSTFDEFYQNHPSYCHTTQPTTVTQDENSLSPKTIDIDLYEMSEIISGLYLGNARDSEHLELLKKNNIQAIINISQTIPCHYESEFDYLQLQCNDSLDENIFQYFDKTFEYINMKLSLNQNVLVHCQGGISRSPSFVIGYLMKYKSLTYSQAYMLVKNKRIIINPNFNFRGQLTKYEQSIMPTTSE